MPHPTIWQYPLIYYLKQGHIDIDGTDHIVLNEPFSDIVYTEKDENHENLSEFDDSNVSKNDENENRQEIFDVGNIKKENIDGSYIKSEDPLLNVEVAINEEKGQVHEEEKPKFKPFKCSICPANFTQKRNLRDHVEHVHEGKIRSNFKCSNCDVSCSSKQRLRDHIALVHEGKMPYKCPICGICFQTRSGLTSHKKSHERLFSCDICEEAFFPQKADLQDHIHQVHDGKKVYRYKCTYCGIIYSNKKILKDHIATVHEGKGKQYKCSKCDASFQTDSGLKVSKF